MKYRHLATAWWCVIDQDVRRHRVTKLRPRDVYCMAIHCRMFIKSSSNYDDVSFPTKLVDFVISGLAHMSMNEL